MTFQYVLFPLSSIPLLLVGIGQWAREFMLIFRNKNNEMEFMPTILPLWHLLVHLRYTRLVDNGGLHGCFGAIVIVILNEKDN